MSHCFCCSGKLLRHVRSKGIYWFCSNCRQEMPCLDRSCQIPNPVPNSLRPSTVVLANSHIAIGGIGAET